MIELEKTYLLKYFPKDFDFSEYKEIYDVYVGVGDHPILRVRKNGEKYEITKKYPVSGTDSSKQIENTIEISEGEFCELAKLPSGRKIRKFRYDYFYKGQNFEFDVFKDDLFGLVLIDAEFATEDEKDRFSMPDFALVDVTQEKIFAGGVLSGKKYEDIVERLNFYNYQKLK